MTLFKDSSEAEAFLRAGNVFYIDEPIEEWGDAHRCINMNDTFGWALAYGPPVDDDQMIPLAELFWRYGNGGLYYWCTIHPDPDVRIERSEFHDVQRAIDFVAHEEALRTSGMPSHERAYHPLSYRLGPDSHNEKEPT